MRFVALCRMPRGFGIYIHLPFCTHRCSYCDFYSLARKDEAAPYAAVVDGLVAEIAGLRHELQVKNIQLPLAETIFLGGGTPSLFPAPLLEQVFAAVKAAFPWAGDAEITMEANPETVTTEYLESIQKHTPVNRISMGAQSFDSRHLKTLERLCTPDDVKRAAGLVRKAGFRNFNLDLIFAIPGQTLEEVVCDVETAASLLPTHISFYQLTLTRGHKLFSSLPDETFQVEGYERGVAALEKAGYEFYEISNFAKPGKECRHNELYWTGGDFLGVGPSASSRLFVDGAFMHRKQVSDLAKYLKDPVSTHDWEKNTAQQSFLEATFLEMRTRSGVDLDDFSSRYGFDLRRSRKLPVFKEQGWVVEENGFLRLTKQGRLLADGICRDLADY
jgi:oxygen-independent coproporphyrinogen-3 oxidase